VAVRLLDGSTLTGAFIDYDGVRQTEPDLLTRGIRYAPADCEPRRVYLDVFPAATPAPAKDPPPCARKPPPEPSAGACVDRAKPRVRVRKAVWRRGVLRARGTSTDRGCRGFRRLVRQVSVRFAGRVVVARGRARWHVRAEAPKRVRRLAAIAVDTAGNRTRRKHRVRRP
jgi:hypothetical protein